MKDTIKMTLTGIGILIGLGLVLRYGEDVVNIIKAAASATTDTISALQGPERGTM